MRKILIIEDDIALQETICDLLEMQDFQVDKASNGIEGLEIASNKELDLVICDVNMPLMNGYETVKRFRELENNIHVPFMFLSALSTMGDLRVGMDLGADDFMTKPFENNELLKIVNRLLSKYSKLKDRELKLLDALVMDDVYAHSKLKDYEDSMERAKVVQSAILPNNIELDRLFKDYGLFHSPKEIVSGDFYWAREVDGKKLIAVGDCTGHGIPAALMTMVCSNMLSICVDHFNLKRPKEILDRVNDLVSDFMSSGNATLSDGMDVALCSIDYENNTMLFSGAKQPLYIISDHFKTNISDHAKSIYSNAYLYKIKGGIGSIGFSAYQNDFEEHIIELNKGDQIYIASDGFCDQFGGRKDKKYKVRRFVDLIQKVHNKPMYDQEKEFKKSFLEWKGENEHTDDVTIFSLKF
jgi:DNA-binding response OmpR family regulator